MVKYRDYLLKNDNISDVHIVRKYWYLTGHWFKNSGISARDLMKKLVQLINHSKNLGLITIILDNFNFNTTHAIGAATDDWCATIYGAFIVIYPTLVDNLFSKKNLL